MKRLLLYFLLAYGITWLLWLPLWGPIVGIEGLPQSSYQHALGGLGPMLAAIILALGEGDGRRRVARWFRPAKLGWAVLAMLVPFLLLGTALAVAWMKNGVQPDWRRLGCSAEFPAFSLAGNFLFNFFFFGFGEEVGWRGYALPRLLKNWKPVPATLLLSVGWAVWHLPAFLYRPGYTAMDVAGIVGWLVSLLAGGLIFTWLYRRTGPGVWTCAAFHAAMDVAFVSDGADPLVPMVMGAAVTLLAIIAAGSLLRAGISNRRRREGKLIRQHQRLQAESTQ